MKSAVFYPAWYCEEKYFLLEKEELFQKVWLFAGLTNWLKKHGDFFTLPLFENEYVIHLLNGEIVSYLNVCPHRGGPLVIGKFGNSMPVCKYHGWSFRDGKELTGLTNNEWFNEDLSNNSCDRKLKNVNVERVGPTIFINLDPNPTPIQSQFNDEILNILENYGNISDTVFCEFESPINWKLNIENVKDYLHPFYVHPETFKPLLDYKELTPSRITANDGELNTYDADVHIQELSFLQRSSLKNATPWWREFVKITQPESTYQNIFLFPNTNFCSVSGAHYVIQQYLPATPTSFEYRLLSAIPEKIKKFDSNALMTTIINQERNVIKEDDVILTKVQRNMAAKLDNSFFTHGDYETPIMNQMLYLKKKVYCE
jgi:phenylpropionate dioxygenase-like ring-hydroxylating dioxygenase large terminal subunit